MTAESEKKEDSRLFGDITPLLPYAFVALFIVTVVAGASGLGEAIAKKL